MRGANNVEICCIEGFDIPEYSDQDTAIASLDNLTIPDDNRESAWKFQDLFVDTSTSMPSRTLRSSVQLRYEGRSTSPLLTALSMHRPACSAELLAKTPHFDNICLDTSCSSTETFWKMNMSWINPRITPCLVVAIVANMVATSFNVEVDSQSSTNRLIFSSQNLSSNVGSIWN